MWMWPGRPAPLESLHDPHDLLRRRRERRHEHDDVTEGTQQHAPGDGPRTHAPTPAQPRRRRIQLDADHEAALTDFAHLDAPGDPFSEQ